MVKDINFKILDDLNVILEQINIGDAVISGKARCFSCMFIYLFICILSFTNLLIIHKISLQKT